MKNALRLARQAETRIRAARVSPDRTIVVQSKTLGTDVSYSLTTENISKSGMLLSWDRKVHVPFLVNTIIEMTIDPAGTWLGTPVSCLGKIVRREEGEMACNARFGVRIVQIDNQDLDTWESCVDKLEKARVYVEPLALAAGGK